MALHIKELDTQPDDVSLIPGPHMVKKKKKDSHNLCSELHTQNKEIKCHQIFKWKFHTHGY